MREKNRSVCHKRGTIATFFEKSIRGNEALEDIQATDLIEHSIMVDPNIKPHRLRQPRYTPDERNFANRVFPHQHPLISRRLEAGDSSDNVVEHEARYLSD
ncbi:hypothetical protein F4805DRAFT_427133 [Annulohypoxylon moriforme]|nr:hypothetical protein F4805DRAFT_427133 [Annulohypoxylon moriforme]